MLALVVGEVVLCCDMYRSMYGRREKIARGCEAVGTTQKSLVLKELW